MVVKWNVLLEMVLKWNIPVGMVVKWNFSLGMVVRWNVALGIVVVVNIMFYWGWQSNYIFDVLYIGNCNNTLPVVVK